MSASSEWVPTKELLEHPDQYFSKHIVLGQHYSLITTHPPSTGTHSCFESKPLYEIFEVANCCHVLIQVESIEEFHRLWNEMAVKAMSLPDLSEPIPLQHYIITTVFPDGHMLSFPHTERK